MITRRGLLAGILGAACAPAIVRSGILMPVRPTVWVPPSIEAVWASHEAACIDADGIWITRPYPHDPLGRRGVTAFPYFIDRVRLHADWMERA